MKKLFLILLAPMMFNNVTLAIDVPQTPKTPTSQYLEDGIELESQTKKKRSCFSKKKVAITAGLLALATGAGVTVYALNSNTSNAHQNDHLEPPTQYNSSNLTSFSTRNDGTTKEGGGRAGSFGEEGPYIAGGLACFFVVAGCCACKSNLSAFTSRLCCGDEDSCW